MTGHLALEQLLAAREPGLEPGVQAWRDHLAACAECQAEAMRLDQRSARLRALPALRPARDQWPALSGRIRAERRVRRFRVALPVGLAAAAALVLFAAASRRAQPEVTSAVALDSVRERSGQLERLIESYNPDTRVTDGVTAHAAGLLEDRIAVVDRQLEAAQMLEARKRDQAMLQLWQERVGLLNALVDVHLTRASAVAF